MLSNIGNTLLFLNILLGIFIIYNLIQNLNINGSLIRKNIYHISLFQSTFIIISFFTLITAFIVSDFSIITVYQNSHSLKPFFYKISGTWGNHEGSLLLWAIILTIFSYLFLFELFIIPINLSYSEVSLKSSKIKKFSSSSFS